MSDTIADDFFGAEPEPAPAPVAEPIAETPVTTDAPESAPPVTPDPEPDEPDAVETPQGRMVPLKAVTASRQRAREAEAARRAAEETATAAKAQADAYQRELEAFRKAQATPPPPPPPPQPPPEAPDPYTQPKEYWAHKAAEEEERAFAKRLKSAKEDFLDDHSEEELDTLMKEWGEVQNAKPALIAELRDSTNPLRFAQRQIKRFKASKQVGDDPDAFLAAEKAKWLAEYTAQNGTPAPTPLVPRVPVPPAVAPRTRVDPATVPASMALERSATPRAAAEPTPDEEFGSMFPASR